MLGAPYQQHRPAKTDFFRNHTHEDPAIAASGRQADTARRPDASTWNAAAANRRQDALRDSSYFLCCIEIECPARPASAPWPALPNPCWFPAGPAGLGVRLFGKEGDSLFGAALAGKSVALAPAIHRFVLRPGFGSIGKRSPQPLVFLVGKRRELLQASFPLGFGHAQRAFALLLGQGLPVAILGGAGRQRPGSESERGYAESEPAVNPRATPCRR